jgi:nucleoside-diphosphate-sugar epimerase
LEDNTFRAEQRAAVPERVVTEADPMTPPHFYIHLGEILRTILEAKSVRTIVLAPGQLYGRGGGYIVPIAGVFNGIRAQGVVHAVKTDNAFTYVHVDDLADLYALALQNPSARGLYIAATDTVCQLDVARGQHRSRTWRQTRAGRPLDDA